MLFDTFEKTFKERGHNIVDKIKDADVVFFDLHSRIGNYNADMNEVLRREVPTVFFDFWDYGGCKDETSEWFGFDMRNRIQSDWWYFYFNCLLGGVKIIYFMRKMDKEIANYPKFIYPIELIQYPDHDFPLVNKEELFARKNDICFIGNTSPTRSNLIAGLLKYKCFHVDYRFNSYERVPHEEWLERHRQAKFFVEACGGGFGSERTFQLMSIAPMLRNKSNHLRLNDWKDMEDCVEISENPTEKDCEKLLSVLNDKDRLYEMYLLGVQRMRRYYTSEYRANYILSTLKQNGIT
jgi:hypothetical protein